MNKIKTTLTKLAIRFNILINTINIKLVEMQLRGLAKEDVRVQKSILNLIKTHNKKYSYEALVKASIKKPFKSKSSKGKLKQAPAEMSNNIEEGA